jgi:eukaryotic-like serine/threonine-protein kinase
MRAPPGGGDLVLPFRLEGPEDSYSVDPADTATPDRLFDIWIFPLGADAKPFAWLSTDHNEIQPAFSPNGHWIAYTSDQTGRKNVYVRRFDGRPASSRALPVSIDGGSHPQWRRNGREIFFLSPERKLMSVEVKGSSDLEFGPPRALFQTAVTMADVFVPYGVSGDGRRFLVNTPTEKSESAT